MSRFICRFFGAAALGVSVLAANPVYAECIGVSRTITLSPDDAFYVDGNNDALGLQDKEVVLTFDDGPMIGTTQKILDTLKDECTKATFFVVGRMAMAYPKLLRRIKSEGHTIGHHTQAHNRMTSYSTANGEKHIDRGIRSVQKIAYGGQTELHTPFFRYPYLARSKKTDRLLRKKGLIAFGANVDSRDWEGGTPYSVERHILRQLKSRRKGVVLLHDIKRLTAKMLPSLLRSLKSEGYRIVHVVPGKAKAGSFLSAGLSADLKQDRQNDALEIKTASISVADLRKLGRTKRRQSVEIEVQSPKLRAKVRLKSAQPVSKINKPATRTLTLRGTIKPDLKAYSVVWTMDAKGRPMIQLARR